MVAMINFAFEDLELNTLEADTDSDSLLGEPAVFPGKYCTRSNCQREQPGPSSRRWPGSLAGQNTLRAQARRLEHQSTVSNMKLITS